MASISGFVRRAIEALLQIVNGACKSGRAGRGIRISAMIAVPVVVLAAVLSPHCASAASDPLTEKIDRANAALECSFIAQIVQKKLDEVKYEEYREKETYLYGLWRKIAEEIRFPGPLLNAGNQAAYVGFYEHSQPRTKVSLDFILGSIYSRRMAEFVDGTDADALGEADYAARDCDTLIGRQ